MDVSIFLESVVGATCAFIFSIIIHESTHYFIGNQIYKRNGKFKFKKWTAVYIYKPLNMRQDLDVTLGGIMAGLVFLLMYSVLLPITLVYIPVYLMASKHDLKVVLNAFRKKTAHKE